MLAIVALAGLWRVGPALSGWIYATADTVLRSKSNRCTSVQFNDLQCNVILGALVWKTCAVIWAALSTVERSNISADSGSENWPHRWRNKGVGSEQIFSEVQKIIVQLMEYQSNSREMSHILKIHPGIRCILPGKEISNAYHPIFSQSKINTLIYNDNDDCWQHQPSGGGPCPIFFYPFPTMLPLIF